MPQLPGSWFLCGGFRLYPGHFRHAQVGAAIGDKPDLLGRRQGDAAVRHFMAEGASQPSCSSTVKLSSAKA